MANLKAHIGGFIVRRELSEPNERIAIEMDLQGAKQWFDESVGTGDEAFKTAIAKAEAEILKDLRSPAIRKEIWQEARHFVREIFGEPVLRPEPALAARAILFG